MIPPKLDNPLAINNFALRAKRNFRLIRESGAVLLDAMPDRALERAIRERLEVGHDRIADLHVWRLGPGHQGAIVSLVSDAPEPVEHYRARLDSLPQLSHLTIEVHRCPDPH